MYLSIVTYERQELDWRGDFIILVSPKLYPFITIIIGGTTEDSLTLFEVGMNVSAALIQSLDPPVFEFSYASFHGVGNVSRTVIEDATYRFRMRGLVEVIWDSSVPSQ
jgi:hypothetical protein